MTYISKGAVLKACDKEKIVVNRCGRDYVLCGDTAKIWLAGRFKVAELRGEKQDPSLQSLFELGLVEITDAASDLGGYRLLSGCVICMAVPAAVRSLLRRDERQVWKWLTGAGFKLRISELVYLADRGIKPDPSLMGKDNWQTLVETIYTTDTIFDGILDAMMERSPAKAATVDAVLGLLRKKRILLV